MEQPQNRIHFRRRALPICRRKREERQRVNAQPRRSFDHAAGRLPKTEYRLSPSGRRALERYLNHMEALIRATREG